MVWPQNVVKLTGKLNLAQIPRDSLLALNIQSRQLLFAVEEAQGDLYPISTMSGNYVKVILEKIPTSQCFDNKVP